MTPSYSVAPTIDGFEVIDDRGRPTGEQFPDRAQAQGHASTMTLRSAQFAKQQRLRQPHGEDATLPRSEAYDAQRTPPRKTVPTRRAA